MHLLKRFSWILNLALLLILLACACQKGGSQAIQLTAQDAGKTFDLRTGATLSITLEGNPTTGYLWEVDPQQELTLLEQTGEAEFKADSRAIGTGGKLTLRFKALKAGQTTLRLLYHRPWEESVEPAETFEVTLNIK